jgi:hypothetical protein
MKKLFSFLVLIVTIFTFSTNSARAQDYKTGAGLQIDFGDGVTFVGPHIKHFFTQNNALEADILFGGSTTMIQAFYQYNSKISGAPGLKWYLGGGPAVQLYEGGSDFYLRPMTGLDYKIPSAPIAFAFDWRPAIYLGDGGGNNFEPARFGLGFRFTF